MAKTIGPTEPDTGEATGAQRSSGPLHGLGRAGGSLGLDNFKPPAGAFKTWREMKKHPTVALARMVSTAPIRTAEIGVECEDGTDEEQVEFIKGIVKDLWHDFINSALLGCDYGYSPFEVIYESSEGQIAPVRLKPLLVDITEILVDKAGNFSGLKNGGKGLEGTGAVELEVSQSFLWTHDEEAGMLYGRSLLENIRSAWKNWMDTALKSATYFARVAGATPVIKYPDGESKDAGGADRPNFEIAKTLVESLEKARGIYLPDIPMDAVADAMRTGGATEATAWKIETFEAKGAHGAEFEAQMRYYDTLMLRGLMVPERSAVEAQTAGSRADSESHGDIGTSIANLKLVDICQAFNRQIVDPVMTLNYGPGAAGTVWVAPEGLSSGAAAFFRTLLQTTLAAPGAVKLFLNLVDVPTLCSLTGLPKPKKDVTTEELLKLLPDVGEPPPGGEPGKPGAGGFPPKKKADTEDLAASMVDAVRETYARASDMLALGHEDQPRDADGKWTDTAGGVVGGATAGKVVGGGGVVARQALTAWGARGHELKPALRSGATLSPEHAAWTKTIDKHLETSTPYDGEVYRGIRMTPNEAAALKVGGEISDKSFQSTSANEKTATNYALPRILDDKPTTSVVVKIEKGHGGVDISREVGDTAVATEKEVLLPRNTKLKILSVERHGSVMKVTARAEHRTSPQAPCPSTTAKRSTHGMKASTVQYSRLDDGTVARTTLKGAEHCVTGKWKPMDTLPGGTTITEAEAIAILKRTRNGGKS
jgi:hypothetical protein